ncbi:MAG: hypothetical protein SangKO_056440 [Sandaracinaceae bacterium]
MKRARLGRHRDEAGRDAFIAGEQSGADRGGRNAEASSVYATPVLRLAVNGRSDFGRFWSLDPRRADMLGA